jgi:phospholipase A1
VIYFLIKFVRIKIQHLISLSLLLGHFLTNQITYGYVDEITPELSIFSEYKPTYIIMGHPDTKVQISFKAQIVRAMPLYFAYSQLMIWELFIEPSSPFRDINFNPELFYRLHLNENSKYQWLDFGIYEHESNGKDGADSRSWDRIYLRYATTFLLDSEHGSKLHLTAKAWIPFNYDSTNPDLAKYRGIYEITVSLIDFMGESFERDDLTLRIYPGGWGDINPLKGGQELTFRLKAKSTRFLPMLVAQIFHGYAENMLDYRENRFGIRAGIGF